METLRVAALRDGAAAVGGTVATCDDGGAVVVVMVVVVVESDDPTTMKWRPNRFRLHCANALNLSHGE